MLVFMFSTSVSIYLELTAYCRYRVGAPLIASTVMLEASTEQHKLVLGARCGI